MEEIEFIVSVAEAVITDNIHTTEISMIRNIKIDNDKLLIQEVVLENPFELYKYKNPLSIVITYDGWNNGKDVEYTTTFDNVKFEGLSNFTLDENGMSYNGLSFKIDKSNINTVIK